jgi:hypothetical protein
VPQGQPERGSRATDLDRENTRVSSTIPTANLEKSREAKFALSDWLVAARASDSKNQLTAISGLERK